MPNPRQSRPAAAKSQTKAPVIALPQEAEHFVIHSDVGTPSAAEPQTRRVSVSVRRRRSSDVERKPSPGDRRRSPNSRFSAVEPPKHKPCSGGRELSPPQEEGRLEDEKDGMESEKKPLDAPVDSEPDQVTTSPGSLRREIDVLRLQVQALKDVQEQTAEIHWKVISNVVEERNLWESRYKEVTQIASKMDAAVSMTPSTTPPSAKHLSSSSCAEAKTETRFVAVQPPTNSVAAPATPAPAPASAPPFCRSVVDGPKIDLFGARQQKIVTRYTLPSSLCIMSTPEGVATLGRCSPVPQVPLSRTLPSQPIAPVVNRSPEANAAVRVSTVQKCPPALEGKILDLSKLPTPCRSMAQQARCFVGDETKATGPKKEKDMVSVHCQTSSVGPLGRGHGAVRRCSRCGALESQAA